MKPADAEAILREDLGSNSEMLAACLAILNSITHARASDLQRISYAAISRMAGLQGAEASLPLITYLTGERLPLLEVRFTFIDEEDEEPVDNQSVEAAMSGEEFFSPRTGEVVPNALDHIFAHFVVSDKARQLVGAAR